MQYTIEVYMINRFNLGKEEISMKEINRRNIFKILFSLAFIFSFSSVQAVTIQEIKQRGEIRHLGVKYANFIIDNDLGFSIDLIKDFAKHLGVKYKFVESDWGNIVGDLTGKKVKSKGDAIEILGTAEIKGDIIETGFTVLPWREKIVDFSTPIFPTQVWLLVEAKSSLTPIQPTQSLEKDIELVKEKLKGQKVLAVAKTCLDPTLYKLDKTGAKVTMFSGNLNELAPQVMAGKADATLLDVPDALVAINKFKTKAKIIGPISEQQIMATAFSKESTELKDEYNKFLQKYIKEGKLTTLLKKHYPDLFFYYPDFIKTATSK